MFAGLSYCGGYSLHQNILEPSSAFYVLIQLVGFFRYALKQYTFALYFGVLNYNLKEGNKKIQI